tara:strand:+ start:643 stop:1677 length:1035 start_codon:yes stop_codon:yes gene_type:complete
MGIKGLTQLLKKKNAYNVLEKHLSKYKGKKIAIDTSILLYKYRYGSGNDQLSHIYGILGRCISFLSNGIIPIFVHDGEPPEEKSDVLSKRTDQRKKLKDKIENLKIQIREYSSDSDSSDDGQLYKLKANLSKLEKQVVNVSQLHRKEIFYLLKLLGVPNFIANGEGEASCAELQKKGIADYAYTEDMDILTFGCTKFLRASNKKDYYTEISLDNILENLKMNHNEFIDLCILCGCDYTCTIPKVGMMTAFNLINKERNIDQIIEKNTKYNIPEDFKYIKARELFKQDVIIPKTSFEIEKIKEEELIKFLLEEKKMPEKYVERYIQNFKKVSQKFRVNTVKNYFK